MSAARQKVREPDFIHFAQVYRGSNYPRGSPHRSPAPPGRRGRSGRSRSCMPVCASHKPAAIHQYASTCGVSAPIQTGPGGFLWYGKRSPAMIGWFENFDFLSGEMRPTTSARSWEVTNGFARKCHPSLRTSIPSGNPDISSTLSCGRSRVIAVAKSTPDIPVIWKSDRRRSIAPLNSRDF